MLQARHRPVAATAAVGSPPAPAPAKNVFDFYSNQSQCAHCAAPLEANKEPVERAISPPITVRCPDCRNARFCSYDHQVTRTSARGRAATVPCMAACWSASVKYVWTRWCRRASPCRCRCGGVDKRRRRAIACRCALRIQASAGLMAHSARGLCFCCRRRWFMSCGSGWCIIAGGWYLVLQMIGISLLVLLNVITAPIMLLGLASWRSATAWSALSDKSLWRHAVLLGLLVNLALDLPFVVLAGAALLSWRHHQIRLVVARAAAAAVCEGWLGQVWTVFGLVALDLMFLPCLVVRAWQSSPCLAWPCLSYGHCAVCIQRAAPTVSHPRHLGELSFLPRRHQPVPRVRSRPPSAAIRKKSIEAPQNSVVLSPRLQEFAIIPVASPAVPTRCS
jgi:hypothetical protein